MGEGRMGCLQAEETARGGKGQAVRRKKNENRNRLFEGSSTGGELRRGRGASPHVGQKPDTLINHTQEGQRQDVEIQGKIADYKGGNDGRIIDGQRALLRV